jgi:hypothetical protein
MGGTGNTGQTGEVKGLPTMTSGTPATPSTPDWAAPATTPAAALADTPATLRPYEQATGVSTGLLSTTPPTTAPATGTLATNPTTATAGPTGFQHDPYPTAAAEVPTVSGQAPPVVPETPATPAEVPMRQIWQPQGGNMTASQWLAANPNWETDFNRAEQRADGTWWVPQDPNAPRPAGPQYYQGTGNVTYGGSPPAGQLR